MSAGSSINPFSNSFAHGNEPEVLDVHGAAASEVEQPLEALRRAPSLVRAAVVRLSLGPHQRSAAGVARGGHLPPAGALRALRHHRTDDLGDDVACAADDHGIPHPHILSADLVLVVQRRVGHGDPAHEHGLEHGERRHLAGATGVHVDGAQARGAFLGRELERDRPPRRVRCRAQLSLQVGAIDLDHRTVDLPVHRVTMLLPVAQERPDGLDRVLVLGGRRHRQARRRRPVQEPKVRVEGHALRRPERVDPHSQRPRGGDLRVLLS